MSFLNPILLTGLAAVGIPILIHLLNRRRFQKIVWAAMRFLQLSIEQNQKRMRLEDLLLLLLRCLMLALLALALARPALRSDSPRLFGQAKVTGALLLDNSASMGVTDGTQTRFDKARDTALHIIDSLPPGSSIAILLASDIAQAAIPEPTFDLNLARKTVREAPLTDRASDLFPALDQAISLLSGRLAIRKEIFLLTDGQAAGWRQLTEIQKILERARNEIKTHLILINEQEEKNLGVSDLRLASGLSPVGQALRFEVRVTNYGQQEARDVPVRLSLGQEAPLDEFTIPTLAPGASRHLSLFAKLPELGFHTISARLPGDRLPADDARTIAVRAIQKIQVLLVDGEPGQEARESEVYFLRHALTPVSLERQETYFLQTKVVASSDLGQVRWDDFDAVVLANVAHLTEPNLQNLVQYLRRGGGLILFTGSQTDLDFYNDQLWKRWQILPAQLSAPEGNATQEETFVRLQDTDYPHPITAIWNDPASGTLGSARFFRRHPLLLPSGATNENIAAASTNAAPGEAGLPRLVARYADGVPAIAERTWGLGRVILVGTSADTAWNDLPVRPAFLPLLHRILGAIAERQDEGLNVTVGETFRRRVSPEWLGKDAIFRSPRDSGATPDLRRVELINARPTLQYTATDYAGVYQASVADPPLALKFAAQAIPGESTLETLSPAQLQTLKDLAEVLTWSPTLSVQERMEQQRTGLEFWLPILQVVLALVALETLLAQWFSRSK